jgi:dinuclear metal center YbgI/SA1388 family protein
MITTEKLDTWFRSFLEIEEFFSVDTSLNGLQVDNEGGEIQKIAFAVDACLESFKRAADAGAGLLFVHHGLFWEKPLALTSSHRERIKFLLDHNLALYACHLPLDQHPEVGNNAALAELLGIEDPGPFGMYHGKKIGYKGNLKKPLSVDEAAKRISFGANRPVGVYPFGKKENLSCAVISGGAAFEVFQAIEEGVDLYVTGENSHSVYHHLLENGINMIAGGHYATEVWGVRSVMERCAHELYLDTEFIDVPTGL